MYIYIYIYMDSEVKRINYQSFVLSVGSLYFETTFYPLQSLILRGGRGSIELAQFSLLFDYLFDAAGYSRRG
jgi:hypothetical protein